MATVVNLLSRIDRPTNVFTGSRLRTEIAVGLIVGMVFVSNTSAHAQEDRRGRLDERPLVEDRQAQGLGEKVHQHLRAVSKLGSFHLATDGSNSFYKNPEGLIGLKDTRSLDHLKAALEKRKVDRALSTISQVWAWKDRTVLSTSRHQYTYDGTRFDFSSARTWDGKQGWWRDSPKSIGRFATFNRTFQSYCLRPCHFLFLGDHQFSWADRGDYPLTFISSTIPVEWANYRSLESESFGGELCDVIRSIPRAEQLWISQETGRVRGALVYALQGRFKPIHEIDEVSRVAKREFISSDEAKHWLEHTATNEQRLRIQLHWLRMHEGIQRPQTLIEFSDYEMVGSGIELPMTEWSATWRPVGEQFAYDVTHCVIKDVRFDFELTPLIHKAQPKQGDQINDYRFATPIQYTYDPTINEAEILKLAGEVQQERQANEKYVERMLLPLKSMVGSPAPKLVGEWLTSAQKPDKDMPTLVHFWSDWCGPCKNDIPKLNQLAQSHWNVIGVHAPGIDQATVKAAIKKHDIQYPVFMGEDTSRGEHEASTVASYPIAMYPCCVLIDTYGKVQSVGSLSDVIDATR